MKKKIFIHVGPPKTGTSAAQNWFCNNEELLRDNGVYYPVHGVDRNGVSSGNLHAIYDLKSTPESTIQVELCVERLNSLLEEFSKSEHHALLLSSEYFLSKILELKRHIPHAKFIAYIRNPMAIIESRYNQSVKRRFQQDPLNVERSNSLPHLDGLVEYVSEHGADDLIIRLYGSQYFVNGNIVSDILSQLGVHLSANPPIVNTSYQFEALEFKRWFNQFELKQHQRRVDRALQTYSSGCSNYSLIPTQRYIDDSLHYAQLIQDYAFYLGKSDLEPLIKDMKEASPKRYIKQGLTPDAFLSVCHFLQATLTVEYYALTRSVRKSRRARNDDFRKLFIGSCEEKYKFLFWVLLVRNKTRAGLTRVKRRSRLLW